jgi:hypothetical protein
MAALALVFAIGALLNAAAAMAVALDGAPDGGKRVRPYIFQALWFALFTLLAAGGAGFLLRQAL